MDGLDVAGEIFPFCFPIFEWNFAGYRDLHVLNGLNVLLYCQSATQAEDLLGGWAFRSPGQIFHRNICFVENFPHSFSLIFYFRGIGLEHKWISFFMLSILGQGSRKGCRFKSEYC
jgi:hypothetical protein